MNLDDQIRRELRERASSIDVQAAGPRSIINAARARTRRARIAGGVAAFALVVGVGSVALAVRDGGDSQDDTTVAAVGDEPAPESAGASDSAAPSATDSGTTGNQETEELEVAATEQDPGPEQAAPSEDDAPQPPAEASTPDSTATLRSLELVAHEAGFIAIRNDRDNGFGATLWSTTDGLEWTPISDPKPTAQASITAIVSDDGRLYAAGERTAGGASRPWVAVTSDTTSWQSLEVPTPSGDGSDLTETYARLYSLAAGPAGLLVTGETITDPRVDVLLDPAVVSSGSWSLGDSSGDLSKLVIYDENGDVERELALVDEGVPQATVDNWSDGNPTPFVAVMGPTDDALVQVDLEIEPGALLLDAAIEDSFVASGLSRRVSSLVLWESTDGAEWVELPVGVVGNAQADVVGHIGDRLVVFATDGPVLAVQYRDGQEWLEVRLDEQFAADDEHRLVDANFHSTGAAAVVRTTPVGGPAALWLLRSDDGATWTVDGLGSVISGDDVVDVTSLALSGGSLAIGIERTGQAFGVTVLDR